MSCEGRDATPPRLAVNAAARHSRAMDRETVIRTIRAHEAELRAEGVAHVYLFGSVARGDADKTSDIDLFYEYDNPRFSLINVVRVQERFQEILGCKVDAMTRDSVHPRIRRRVEAEAVQVY
jgi:uncharacterized protein